MEGGREGENLERGSSQRRPAAEAAADERRIREERLREDYRFAAIMFVGGGLGAILPTLFQPPRAATFALLPTMAVGTGLLVWVLATRLSWRGVHVVAVVAALEVAVAAALVDQSFAVYFVLIAVFLAYVLPSRRAIAAHIGFVVLLSFAPAVYDPDAARDHVVAALVLLPVLVLCAGAVAVMRDRLAASEGRYRELSEIDPLTDVGNYRMMALRVPQELERHQRHGRPLSVLMIDLDDFKRINDEHGHLRGDQVLQEVAKALLGGVRGHDIVVRQGGDEFAVIAPETGPEEAHHLAERLRSAVRGLGPGDVDVGASIGCAFFPTDADTLEGLLTVAGRRLRDAKQDRAGRYGRDPGVAPGMSA